MGAVAGRYARAFAEVVAEHKLDATTVVEELGEIAALVNGHAELRNVLENPAVEQKQKLGLLDAIIKRLRAGKLLKPPSEIPTPQPSNVCYRARRRN